MVEILDILVKSILKIKNNCNLTAVWQQEMEKQAFKN
jgi:hypothetical protein